MKIQSYLLSVLFAFSGFTAQEDPPLFYAEVDIVEGKSLSRLYVFLVNESNTLIEVLTGSSGGAGCFDDRQDEGVGTGIRAIPELLFARSQNQNNFFIRIAPPHLIQGITLRSMQPSFLQIQPKSWIDYYSFDVPSRHIQHDFIQGQIRFESGYKFEGSEKAFLSERIVPILKVNRYPGDSSQLALAILEENLQEECYYFKCRFSPRIKKIVLKNTFFLKEDQWIQRGKKIYEHLFKKKWTGENATANYVKFHQEKHSLKVFRKDLITLLGNPDHFYEIPIDSSTKWASDPTLIAELLEQEKFPFVSFAFSYNLGRDSAGKRELLFIFKEELLIEVHYTFQEK